MLCARHEFARAGVGGHKGCGRAHAHASAGQACKKGTSPPKICSGQTLKQYQRQMNSRRRTVKISGIGSPAFV